MGSEAVYGWGMTVSQTVEQTLTFYLDELAAGDVDAAEAKRRILESFDRQGLVIAHRESVPLSGDIARAPYPTFATAAACVATPEDPVSVMVCSHNATVSDQTTGETRCLRCGEVLRKGRARIFDAHGALLGFLHRDGESATVIMEKDQAPGLGEEIEAFDADGKSVGVITLDGSHDKR
jgi:hypothetical protein